MRDMFPANCHRCFASVVGKATTMSKFNTDMICMDCKVEERKHPSYEAADAIEVAAVRSGNYNFPGIGAPPDLVASSRARAQAEKADQSVEA